MSDSTQRFSNRVADYVKYRPGYPREVITALLDHTGLDTNAVVADIGSGTGLFTRSLLEQGLQVFAVEPNPNMRSAAEELLSGYPGFTSRGAPAEKTGLADHSVDLVAAAQAFHWFNNEDSKAEFLRILKPGGNLALIWNQRRMSHPFQQAYDAMLEKHAPEYQVINHMNLSDADLADFFAEGKMQTFSFDNRQRFDFAGLVGRVKSCSYCPQENTAAYDALLNELGTRFDQYAVNGVIDFEYDARLYLGPLDR